MTDTDRVLASIDETLDGYVSEDCAISGDAMRWRPEEPDNVYTVRYDLRVTGINPEVVRRALQPIGQTWRRQADAASKAFASISKALNKNVSRLHVQTAPLTYGDSYRKHRARCRLCNPFGNPKPLTVDGAEYQRRARARRRRNRR